MKDEIAGPAAPPEPEPRIRFLIDLGRALHESGLPAHRLEEALGQTAGRLGIRAEFFSTPTSLTSSFGEPGRQHTALSRVQPASLRLDRLVALDEVVQALHRGEVGVQEAGRRLQALERAPQRYGPALTTLAFGLISGTAARFFGGGWAEVGLAGGLGLLTGLFALAAARRETLARLFEFVVAMVVTLAAHLAAATVCPAAEGQVVVAGLIVLLPGLTLTLAMNELATGHLVSGTARLMGALMTFFKIGLGVGIGAQLAEFMPWPVAPAGTVAAMPAAWTLWLALLLTPAGLTVLFGARWRQLPWIAAGALVAFWGARLGVAQFGLGLGSVVGALGAGVAGNLFARTTGRPSVVVLVPAIILLVPGTIGYQSFSLLLAQDVTSGIESAFTVLLVGVSLVAGLLLANVVLPPRHKL